MGTFEIPGSIRSKKKVTDEVLVSEYARLGNVWKVAKSVGICGQSVQERLVRLGIKRNLIRLSNEEKEIVTDYYKKTPENVFSRDELLKLLPPGTTMSRLEHIVTKIGAGKFGRTHSENDRKKSSQSRTGIKPPHDGFTGFHHSDEAKSKISISSKEKWNDPNFSQNTPLGKIALAARARINGRKVLDSPNAYSRCKRGYYDIPEVGSIYFRSKWEANYALYLQFLVKNKQILSWQYEPKAFEFPVRSGAVFYTPDFLIQNNNGLAEWHEVKGWMDSKSKTKIARMRKYYPQETLIIIGEKEYRGIKKNAKLFGWYE